MIITCCYIAGQGVISVFRNGKEYDVNCFFEIDSPTLGLDFESAMETYLNLVNWCLKNDADKMILGCLKTLS